LLNNYKKVSEREGIKTGTPGQGGSMRSSIEEGDLGTGENELRNRGDAVFTTGTPVSLSHSPKLWGKIRKGATSSPARPKDMEDAKTSPKHRDAHRQENCNGKKSKYLRGRKWIHLILSGKGEKAAPRRTNGIQRSGGRAHKEKRLQEK